MYLIYKMKLHESAWDDAIRGAQEQAKEWAGRMALDWAKVERRVVSEHVFVRRGGVSIMMTIEWLYNPGATHG